MFRSDISYNSIADKYAVYELVKQKEETLHTF
jgi:hypothetical protein